MKQHSRLLYSIFTSLLVVSLSSCAREQASNTAGYPHLQERIDRLVRTVLPEFLVFFEHQQKAILEKGRPLNRRQKK